MRIEIFNDQARIIIAMLGAFIFALCFSLALLNHDVIMLIGAITWLTLAFSAVMMEINGWY